MEKYFDRKPSKQPAPKQDIYAEIDSKFAQLPLVEQMFEVRQIKQITSLLEELDIMTEQEQAAKARADEIKQQLADIQFDYGITGMQHRGLCFMARKMPGRRTLDKLLLAENGVELDVIEKSMKTGEPFIERRFKRMER